MNDLLAKEIARMFRKYSRTYCVVRDENVSLELVSEDGLKLALSEFGEFAIKQAAEELDKAVSEVLSKVEAEPEYKQFAESHAFWLTVVKGRILSLSVKSEKVKK